MHRDIARLLVLLAVVHVLTVVACPAPAPQPRTTHREADRELQRHVYRRKLAMPRREAAEAAKCNNRDRDSTLNPLASIRPLDSPPQRFSNQTSAAVPTAHASRAPVPSVCAPSQPEPRRQTTATGRDRPARPTPSRPTGWCGGSCICGGVVLTSHIRLTVPSIVRRRAGAAFLARGFHPFQLSEFLRRANEIRQKTLNGARRIEGRVLQ